MSNSIEVLVSLMGRAQLAAALGKQYGGKRDIYAALGYPDNITFEDYAARYSRQDMAKAIIDKPVDATWRGGFTLSEPGEVEKTQLETGFSDLYQRLHLLSVFNRLDKLSGLGRYGTLLFGLSDVQGPSDWTNPVIGGSTLSLLYLKPLSEGSCKIQQFETDPTSERFGMPKLYTVEFSAAGSGQSNYPNSLLVHWSRILHVVGGELEVDVFGTPRLQSVFNRLMDLEKLVGGSAEMFWRNARPGYQGKVDKDFTITDDQRDQLQQQLEEFEHDLRRFLINEGISIEALTGQVSDPASHVDAQIQMISAVTGIPKRILTGSERGELASTQDRETWLDMIGSRRDQFAEAKIIRPFVSRCIELKLLPEFSTGRYEVEWSPLYESSENDRAEVGRIRATALKEYSTNPQAESIVPPKAFYKLFLGLEDEQIEWIERVMEDEMLAEESSIQQGKKALEQGATGEPVQ